MKKKKVIIITICTACFMSLLTLSLNLKSICVKTISENYMNISITNQIIDFVIDNYTDLTNDQLKSLQNDMIKSRELYDFNELIFNEIIYHAENEDYQINKDILNNFSNSCIQCIEENLNQKLSSIQKEKIKALIENDLIWNGFSQDLSYKISQTPAFIILYKLSNSIILKTIMIVFVICCLIYFFQLQKELFLVYLMMILILSSLLNYLLLFIVKLSTPVFASLLGLQSLQIITDDIFYVAILLLFIGLMFLFYILKRSYNE